MTLKKSLTLLTLGILIGSLLPIILLTAQTPTKTRITETQITVPHLNITNSLYLSGTNKTDILKYPEQTASYIIFGRDTNGDGVADIIYAKNCSSGEIEFYGADASTVIQNAIDALTSGGIIFIRSGEYNLTATLILDDSIEIVGEGFSTVLKGSLTTLLKIDQAKNVIVKNIQFINNLAGTKRTVALYGQAPPNNLVNCKLINLWIYNGASDYAGNGIWIELLGTKGNGYSNTFRAIYIEKYGTGIYIRTSSNETWFNANHFENICLWYNIVGLTLNAKSAGAGYGIRGNHFENIIVEGCSNSTAGFRLIHDDGQTDVGENNVFINCKAIDLPTGAKRILIEEGYKYTVLIGGNLRKSGFVDNGVGTVAIDRDGLYLPCYVKKGSITLLNGSTSIAFEHGLTSTPTVVTATPTTDLGSASYWWVTYNSTHITIHVNADPGKDVTFNWRAEVN